MGGYQGLLLPILLIVVMYVLLILPQRKREKKMREMINSLKEGNNVVTIGGIFGKIVSMNDDKLQIETYEGKTKLDIMKWSVREVVAEPVPIE